MHQLPLFVFISFLLVNTTCLGMEEVIDFGENPGNLKMYLHVPENVEGIPPVVIALHGCSQNAEELAEVSGWNELADKYNFIVLYPEQKRINNVSNCFNWFIERDIEEGRGELASVKSMIKHLQGMYETDGLFVYGLSAGAGMANSLMANDAADYLGGAIFAGAPHGAATNAFAGVKVMVSPNDSTPEEWGAYIKGDGKEGPKVIVVHGTEDKVVNIRNSEELVDQWTGYYHLEGDSILVEGYAQNALVERISYSDSTDTEKVVFYRLTGVGHELAIDPGSGEAKGGKLGRFTTDINFYSTYYVAREFGLITD